MAQAKRRVRREAAEMLYLLDSSSLTLKGRGFDGWTQATRTRNTQGMKLHLLYDAQAGTPLSASMTAANVNDRDEGVKLAIETGATYVFDKGYCDYTWWHRIDQSGASFVTRFKRNANLRVEQERLVLVPHQEIVLKDEIVRFANKHPRGGRKNPYQTPLRRITLVREEKEPLVLATNDLNSPALTIAAYYKARWGIELFFKWIKQHLKVKRFFGKTENAVRIQLLIALITYLLLSLYRQTTQFKGSLWELLSTARASLFQRPSIEFLMRRRRTLKRLALQQIQPDLFSSIYPGQ
jgi:IS4 transposase